MEEIGGRAGLVVTVFGFFLFFFIFVNRYHKIQPNPTEIWAFFDFFSPNLKTKEKQKQKQKKIKTKRFQKRKKIYLKNSIK